jgi:hypothetical protein
MAERDTFSGGSILAKAGRHMAQIPRPDSEEYGVCGPTLPNPDIREESRQSRFVERPFARRADDRPALEEEDRPGKGTNGENTSSVQLM